MKNVPNLGFEAIKNLREAIDRDLVLSHDFCENKMMKKRVKADVLDDTFL